MTQITARYIISNAVKAISKTALGHRRYTRLSQQELILRLGDSKQLLAYALYCFTGDIYDTY